MASPPLGFVTEDERTPDQHDAHARAVAASAPAARTAAPVPQLAKGDRLVLTDLWTHPDVVADVGRRFIRELQNTGSCVKVGGTNAVRCTIAAQRVASDNPTKAFEPFCWHNYALSRHYWGADREGEGSMGSTFARSLTQDGIRDWPADLADDLPDYKQSGDHINISAAEEMRWSSVRNPTVAKVQAVSKAHLFGSAEECRTTDDVKRMVLNGYGVTFACDRYVGRGRVKGEGKDAYVAGYWDAAGGHQQWVFGYWEHPADGPLFAVGNNWPDDTYPKDPAGLPLCTLWVSERDVASAMRNLHAEVFGLSHLNWFPAQPRLLSWIIAP